MALLELLATKRPQCLRLYLLAFSFGPCEEVGLSFRLPPYALAGWFRLRWLAWCCSRVLLAGLVAAGFFPLRPCWRTELPVGSGPLRLCRNRSRAAQAAAGLVAAAAFGFGGAGLRGEDGDAEHAPARVCMLGCFSEAAVVVCWLVTTVMRNDSACN